MHLADWPGQLRRPPAAEGSANWDEAAGTEAVARKAATPRQSRRAATPVSRTPSPRRIAPTMSRQQKMSGNRTPNRAGSRRRSPPGRTNQRQRHADTMRFMELESQVDEKHAAISAMMAEPDQQGENTSPAAWSLAQSPGRKDRLRALEALLGQSTPGVDDDAVDAAGSWGHVDRRAASSSWSPSAGNAHGNRTPPPVPVPERSPPSNTMEGHRLAEEDSRPRSGLRERSESQANAAAQEENKQLTEENSKLRTDLRRQKLVVEDLVSLNQELQENNQRWSAIGNETRLLKTELAKDDEFFQQQAKVAATNATFPYSIISNHQNQLVIQELYMFALR